MNAVTYGQIAATPASETICWPNWLTDWRGRIGLIPLVIVVLNRQQNK